MAADHTAPDPLGRRRVYQVAEDLGADSATVIRLAQSYVHVSSASSWLVRDVIDAVRSAYELETVTGRPGQRPPAVRMTRPAPQPPVAHRRHSPTVLPSTVAAADEETLRLLLGDRRPRFRKVEGQKAAQVPPGDLEQLLHRAAPGNHPEHVKTLAGNWGRNMFPPGEVQRWLDAGLRIYEYGLAVQLRANAIEPRHLGYNVNGSTVLEKLRSERPLTVGDVLRLLRREGQL
jgi:hypothetical protein